MPARSSSLSIHEQEGHSTDDRDEIEGETGKVLDDAIATERLERSHERALNSIPLPTTNAPCELRLPVLHETRLPLCEQRCVEYLSEGRFEKEGAGEECEQED